jgi:hypothetical protein
MRISDLVRRWETTVADGRTAKDYALRLSVRDAARLEALAAMYPARTPLEILAEIVSAALDDLESSLPYIPGARVIAEDDHGDPIFEDVGPTPRFYALSREFARKLAQSSRPLSDGFTSRRP